MTNPRQTNEQRYAAIAEQTTREWTTGIDSDRNASPTMRAVALVTTDALAERDRLAEQLDGLWNLIFSAATNIGYHFTPVNEDEPDKPAEPLPADVTVLRLAEAVEHAWPWLGRAQQFVDREALKAAIKDAHAQMEANADAAQ